MQPPKRIHEHQMSSEIERETEQYRALREGDRKMELPDSWEMTALWIMVRGEILQSVDIREKLYEKLRAVVLKWAIVRKMENKWSMQDPKECPGPDWVNPTWYS